MLSCLFNGCATRVSPSRRLATRFRTVACDAASANGAIDQRSERVQVLHLAEDRVVSPGRDIPPGCISERLAFAGRAPEAHALVGVAEVEFAWPWAISSQSPSRTSCPSHKMLPG